MMNIDFLLIFLAFLSFVLAALGVASRMNLIGLGLALWTLSILI